jgi:hypothetical protein
METNIGTATWWKKFQYGVENSHLVKVKEISWLGYQSCQKWCQELTVV